jgi:hypothetical protein
MRHSSKPQVSRASPTTGARGYVVLNLRQRLIAKLEGILVSAPCASPPTSPSQGFGQLVNTGAAPRPMIGSTGSSIAAIGVRKQDRAVGLARQAVGIGTHRAPEAGNLERFGEVLSGAFFTLIGIVFGL